MDCEQADGQHSTYRSGKLYVITNDCTVLAFLSNAATQCHTWQKKPENSSKSFSHCVHSAIAPAGPRRQLQKLCTFSMSPGSDCENGCNGFWTILGD